MKISFDETTAPPGPAADTARELKSLCEKLRSRFKVSVAATPEGNVVAVAALGSSEEKLSKTLDAIVDFCEQAGFGRVANEETLFDHIDAIGDHGDE